MSTAGGVIAERLTAQMLAGKPAKDPLTVVRHLLAVQGQDPRGARLAIRARSEGLSAADVDHALSEQRSLLITWLNRGTLHLIASEDYAWLHALTTPRLLTGNARRLSQEGLSAAAVERGVGVIERALADEGPLTRRELRERIDAAGVRTEGQALVHLLILATLRGLTVRGPMREREHAYVLVHDWLGEPVEVDRDLALAELARRYLEGHAPAEDRDLARWSGLGLRDVRAGLNAIASELRERADGLLELRRGRAKAELAAPRLLGAFDPVLLGWRSREELLAGHLELVTVNGLFRPFALVDGRAAGTWALAAGKIELRPFTRFTRAVRAALEADGAAVLSFLGLGSEARSS
ncbi:MAG TPA: winged helix DNA-binding domain-containing protein [Solirubrobacteraceae bacterium]